MGRYGTLVDGREEEEERVRNKLAQRHLGCVPFEILHTPQRFFFLIHSV